MCSVDGCPNRPIARTWCNKHYLRWRKYGDPTTIIHDGYSNRPEYHVWKDMRRRCYRSTFKQYADYGGRGVEVCQQWRDSFRAFLADVGDRPGKGYWIERIDNDGNYEPGNVRWATTKEQALNRRTSRLVTAFGRTQNMQTWADEMGFKKTTLRGRLNAGWPAEKALTTGRIY